MAILKVSSNRGGNKEASISTPRGEVDSYSANMTTTPTLRSPNKVTLSRNSSIGSTSSKERQRSILAAKRDEVKNNDWRGSILQSMDHDLSTKSPSWRRRRGNKSIFGKKTAEQINWTTLEDDDEDDELVLDDLCGYNTEETCEESYSLSCSQNSVALSSSISTIGPVTPTRSIDPENQKKTPSQRTREAIQFTQFTPSLKMAYPKTPTKGKSNATFQPSTPKNSPHRSNGVVSAGASPPPQHPSALRSVPHDSVKKGRGKTVKACKTATTTKTKGQHDQRNEDEAESSEGPATLTRSIPCIIESPDNPPPNVRKRPTKKSTTPKKAPTKVRSLPSLSSSSSKKKNLALNESISSPQEQSPTAKPLKLKTALKLKKRHGVPVSSDSTVSSLSAASTPSKLSPSGINRSNRSKLEEAASKLAASMHGSSSSSILEDSPSSHSSRGSSSRKSRQERHGTLHMNSDHDGISYLLGTSSGLSPPFLSQQEQESDLPPKEKTSRDEPDSTPRHKSPSKKATRQRPSSSGKTTPRKFQSLPLSHHTKTQSSSSGASSTDAIELSPSSRSTPVGLSPTSGSSQSHPSGAGTTVPSSTTTPTPRVRRGHRALVRSGSVASMLSEEASSNKMNSADSAEVESSPANSHSKSSVGASTPTRRPRTLIRSNSATTLSQKKEELRDRMKSRRSSTATTDRSRTRSSSPSGRSVGTTTSRSRSVRRGRARQFTEHDQVPSPTAEESKPSTRSRSRSRTGDRRSKAGNSSQRPSTPGRYRGCRSNSPTSGGGDTRRTRSRSPGVYRSVDSANDRSCHHQQKDHRSRSRPRARSGQQSAEEASHDQERLHTRSRSRSRSASPSRRRRGVSPKNDDSHSNEKAETNERPLCRRTLTTKSRSERKKHSASKGKDRSSWWELEQVDESSEYKNGKPQQPPPLPSRPSMSKQRSIKRKPALSRVSSWRSSRSSRSANSDSTVASSHSGGKDSRRSLSSGETSLTGQKSTNRSTSPSKRRGDNKESNRGSSSSVTALPIPEEDKDEHLMENEPSHNSLSSTNNSGESTRDMRIMLEHTRVVGDLEKLIRTKQAHRKDDIESTIHTESRQDLQLRARVHLFAAIENDRLEDFQKLYDLTDNDMMIIRMHVQFCQELNECVRWDLIFQLLDPSYDSTAQI